MSNYIEYKDKIAFHPGYYIKELIDESGLTQADFAKCLGTTPKNLSILIRGEQSLSIDIAAKLSRMLGTTVNFWLNLQQKYDEMIAEFLSEHELIEERNVFELLNIKYFQRYYPKLECSDSKDEQIKRMREFFRISSLCVLKERDLSVNFRCYSKRLDDKNIVNANMMVQIGIKKALQTDIPKFNRRKFHEIIEHLPIERQKDETNAIDRVRKSLEDAGVVLCVLTELNEAGITGATKKIDGKMMLMISDCHGDRQSLWFSLFHEIGHIINGDFGATFKNYDEESEDNADKIANNMMIKYGLCDN